MKSRKRTRARPRHPAVPEIDWNIVPAIGQSAVDGHPIRKITFSFHKSGSAPFTFSLTAEEAYSLHAEIGRAYDQVN